MTGIIQSVKMVTKHSAVFYDVAIEDSESEVTTHYVINQITLIKICRVVGEYPSNDIATALHGYEIEFTSDSISKLSGIKLVESEEVEP